MAAAAASVLAAAVAAAAVAAVAVVVAGTRLIQDCVKGGVGVRQRTRVGNAQVYRPLAKEVGCPTHALGAIVEESQLLPAVVVQAHHRGVVAHARNQHSRRLVRHQLLPEWLQLCRAERAGVRQLSRPEVPGSNGWPLTFSQPVYQEKFFSCLYWSSQYCRRPNCGGCTAIVICLGLTAVTCALAAHQTPWAPRLQAVTS